jgi:hypothetical protein
LRAPVAPVMTIMWGALRVISDTANTLARESQC